MSAKEVVLWCELVLLALVQISDSGDGQYLLTACRSQATTIEHEPEQPSCCFTDEEDAMRMPVAHVLFKSYWLLLVT